MLFTNVLVVLTTIAATCVAAAPADAVPAQVYADTPEARSPADVDHEHRGVRPCRRGYCRSSCFPSNMRCCAENSESPCVLWTQNTDTASWPRLSEVCPATMTVG